MRKSSEYVTVALRYTQMANERAPADGRLNVAQAEPRGDGMLRAAVPGRKAAPLDSASADTAAKEPVLVQAAPPPGLDRATAAPLPAWMIGAVCVGGGGGEGGGGLGGE